MISIKTKEGYLSADNIVRMVIKENQASRYYLEYISIKDGIKFKVRGGRVFEQRYSAQKALDYIAENISEKIVDMDGGCE